MLIKFIGATKTVTGSMHYLIIKDKKILLDCGLYHGKRKDYYEINANFPYFQPAEIDYVILSHAHIDHCGNIPNLVKRGFEGKIICTSVTDDLCRVMLLDSGYIQEKDAEYVNKKHFKKGLPPVEPLYTQKDAEESLKLLYGIPYHKTFEIDEKIEITFYDAGHILGSAITQMKIKTNGKNLNLTYLGDLGRPKLPIIKDPELVETPDYLITEGTYGARFHQPPQEVKNILIEVLFNALKRNGKIIIPAFSFGRTQQLVLLFHEIFDEYFFSIPIFIDSPLSAKITEIYSKHAECFDEETFRYMQNGNPPFKFAQATYIESVEESKSLNDLNEPAIIISASGMCETGRILHHLANNIEDSRNTILIVGYNAPHTLGRKISEGQSPVKIFGDEYKVKAKVVVLDALSAHADQKEFLNYFSNFDKNKLRKIFLVHGDESELIEFERVLERENYKNISIPDKGDEFHL